MVSLEWASLEMDSSVMVRFHGWPGDGERSRSREAEVKNAVSPEEEERGTLGDRCQSLPYVRKVGKHLI